MISATREVRMETVKSDLKTSDVNREASNTLLYNDRLYIRLQILRPNALVEDGSVRRRVNLWLCVEDSVKFPARPVVVPEYIT